MEFLATRRGRVPGLLFGQFLQGLALESVHRISSCLRSLRDPSLLPIHPVIRNSRRQFSLVERYRRQSAAFRGAKGDSGLDSVSSARYMAAASGSVHFPCVPTIRTFVGALLSRFQANASGLPDSRRFSNPLAELSLTIAPILGYGSEHSPFFRVSRLSRLPPYRSWSAFTGVARSFLQPDAPHIFPIFWPNAISAVPSIRRVRSRLPGNDGGSVNCALNDHEPR